MNSSWSCLFTQDFTYQVRAASLRKIWSQACEAPVLLQKHQQGDTWLYLRGVNPAEGAALVLTWYHPLLYGNSSVLAVPFRAQCMGVTTPFR